MGFDYDGLRHLLDVVQDGTVSRRQLHELGATANDVARLRRGPLRTVSPGVYVDHTGPLSWTQRAWCAVHAHWPAALSHTSALPTPGDRRLDVAVAHGRSLQATPGVSLHRTQDLETRVNWRRSPPRVRAEHAIIDVMSAATVEAAYRALTDLCHTRTATPASIRDVLDQRPRIPQRAMMEGLLDDLAGGNCSILERGYRDRVERRHGLPRGQRQVAAQVSSRNHRQRGYHDVEYRPFGLVVELDGRAFHDTVHGWNTAYDRDLVAAVSGDRTVRLSYRQIFTDPCRTAHQVGVLLRRGGWKGRLVTCPDCPVVAGRS